MRGTVAGNGGQMAEARGKQQKVVSGKTPRTKAKAAGATGKAGRAAKKKAAPATADEATGFESFCQAVADQLHERGPQIARKLGQRSAAGDLPCTKLMLDLTDPAKKRKRKTSGAEESVAIRIAAEPDWVAEECDKPAARRSSTGPENLTS